MGSDIYPFVSIVIPAYNEARYFRNCLESIKNLDYPKERHEIIIVDNGSTDETVQIARQFTSKVYVCPGLNISALRNYGAREARGEIFAFIDADCVADESWLKNAIKTLTIEPCIIGSKYDIPQHATWLEKAWFSQKPAGRCEVAYINSGNMIMPADLFNKLEGFDESLSTGEDAEFCLRAKPVTRVISDDTVRVVHLGNPKTLQQFLTREIWHGLGAFGSFRYAKFDKPLIGTVAFLLLTLCQIGGLIRFIFLGDILLFIYSTAGLLILLSATVLYRTKDMLMRSLQLFLLYYLFYSARTVSFYYLFTKRNYRRTK